MSRGDDEVEPYLDSRNTIGHGNHNPNSQRPKRVKIDIGGSGSKRGHRGEIGRKYAEMAREGGVAAARGRMSGAPDVRWILADVRAPGSGTNAMNSAGKIATPGQNSDELVDGKGW